MTLGYTYSFTTQDYAKELGEWYRERNIFRNEEGTEVNIEREKTVLTENTDKETEKRDTNKETTK
jgi:hypothetical protein